MEIATTTAASSKESEYSNSEDGALSIGEKANGGNYLDPNLWKNFPDDLHAWVLTKSQLESLVKFRLVCKQWNALILLGNFILRSNLSRKSVPLYFCENVPSMIYNRVRNSWQQFSFSFLDTTSTFLSLLVSAGGLLCFKTGIAGELIICNPITKQFRRLQVPCKLLHDDILQIILVPPRLGLHTYAKEVIVGLIMEHGNIHGSGYKLVVAGVKLSGKSPERTTLLYDSITRSWKKGGKIPRWVHFWRSGKPVSCKGYLYCIAYNIYRYYTAEQKWPWSVLRYDLKHDKWSEVEIPRTNCILYQLVEHQGNVLVVQRQCIKQSQIFFSELTEDGQVRLLGRRTMPVDLFPESDAQARGLVLEDWCVGQGDRMFIAGTYPENDFFDPKTNCYEEAFYVEKTLGIGVITHNPTEDTWTQLPDLCGEYYSEGLYAFEPSLARV